MKTFKALFIDNGIIKAGEFPVEPDYCTIGVQDQCEKRDVWVESLHCYTCSCRAKEVEHQQALASAKANAVECEDQEEATQILNKMEGALFLSCCVGSHRLDSTCSLNSRVVLLPSGWDYVEKVRVCTDDCTCAEPCIVRVVAKLYRTDEKKPHGFCEKPNSTCTMNYCDENGCNERKRVLAESKEESQEVLWNKAEGIIAEAMGTYKTSLTVALASYARKELEKHFTITRKP